MSSQDALLLVGVTVMFLLGMLMIGSGFYKWRKQKKDKTDEVPDK